jgi:hypothetical protein
MGLESIHALGKSRDLASGQTMNLIVESSPFNQEVRSSREANGALFAIADDPHY